MFLFLKTKNKIITLLFATIFLLGFFVATQAILAESAYSSTDYGLKTTLSEGGLDTTLKKNSDLPTTAGTIVGAALSFIGVIFLILIIYGGFQWMTAGGNEEQVGKAKVLIISAVVGLMIIASAYLATKFIGETLISTPSE